MTPKKLNSNSENNPLFPIIIDKKNQYNIIDKYNILDQEKNKPRGTCSFYMSRSLYKGWCRYCELSGQKHNHLTEEALLEYMRNHPVPQVTLNVTQDLAAYAPDIKTRLRNKILRDKIGSVIATLHRIQETGRGDRTIFSQQLQKLVLQATNMKHPDADLMELLKEAEDLI